ncbi:hypothetical protein DL771_005629 [Monosporascus sp. 5C6A]|nr:hypothetical protein DL771_005629 [Monosporascus sp. 5C6A]
MNSLDYYRGTVVACRYVIPPGLRSPSRRRELMDVVKAAVIEVISKHPMLQVGLRGADSNKPVWVQLGSIDLREHIEWRHLEDLEDLETSLRSVIESELDIQFQRVDSQPGWRLLVLHQQKLAADSLEILFTYNHPNADGTSGVIFHKDLLHSLDAAQEQQSVHGGPILVLSEAVLRLPPPPEQWSRLPVSAPFVLKSAWDEYRPSVFRMTPTLARWAPIVTSPCKTRVREFSIDNNLLTNVLTACRKNNTTITGLLHSLALVSFASRVDEAIAPAFEGGTPINLRNVLLSKHPEYPGLTLKQTMGNYVTMTSHKFGAALVAQIRSRIDPRDTADSLSPELVNLMWDSAAKVRKEIRSRLDEGVKNDQVGLMKLVGDWRAQLKGKAEKPRRLSWSVTNVGVIEGRCATSLAAQDKRWSIRRAQLGVSAEVPGPALFISALSVAGERLTISCSWQEGVINVMVVERIAADLQKWLVRIGS